MDSVRVASPGIDGGGNGTLNDGDGDDGGVRV